MSPRNSNRLTRGGMHVVAVLVALQAPFVAVGADGNLDATMEPIAKHGAAPRPCAGCADTDAPEGSGARAAERGSPEYPAARSQKAASPDEGLVPSDAGGAHAESVLDIGGVQWPAGGMSGLPVTVP